MKQKIEDLLSKIESLTAEKLQEVEDIRVKLLGKKGEITALFDEFRNVPAEQKREFGQKLNVLKTKAAEKIEELRQKVEEMGGNDAPSFDYTKPGDKFDLGTRHPISITREEIISIFSKFGYAVAEGPEIEDDWHVFGALNFPPEHPARDMQDTFFIQHNPDVLLRTHTSPGQIRVMDSTNPPIKVLVPGKVFRSDSDATHSPMFSQMEGLVVDEKITLCDLQGMLDQFVKALFSDEVKTRLRPSYFPFTEPSVEVDVSCFKCGGKGCSLCKGTGWIEVLGGGIVNNKVLENCNIDSSKYSGLAFGIGIERIAMLKYGINHMGKLFENDIEFLKQFKA